MPGFFSDTSGLDASPDFGSTNNAAADFARSGRPSSDLFSRLFGGNKPSIKVQDLPPPAMPPEAPPPAITSAPSLVGRVLKSSTPAPPQAPPGPRAAPPFDPSMLRQQPVDQPQPLPPFQYPGAGAARAPISMRDVAMQPFQYPGAGAGGAPISPREAASGSSGMGGVIQTLLQALAPLMGTGQPGGPQGFLGQGGLPRTESRGFFARGGYARGGMPDLMFGMPERRAEGDYVAPDGRGNGRSDHIPAVLSPGEYVIDSELVSLLGDGDNDAGARALDQFREDVRRHKGAQLARGGISPDAKRASAYLKGR